MSRPEAWLRHTRPAEPAAYHRCMAVDVVTSIEIARPRTVVAPYAADPDHATDWYPNITSVEWRRHDPPFRDEHRPGSVSHADHLYLGGHALRGTLMTLRNTAKPSGLGNLTAPVMAGAARSANRKDLAKLKAILELSP